MTRHSASWTIYYGGRATMNALMGVCGKQQMHSLVAVGDVHSFTGR